MRWLKYTLLAGMVLGLCAQSITYRRAGRWSLGPPPPPPRSSTYRGTTYSHTDSANSPGATRSVSPYDSANMKAGDLCVLIGAVKVANENIIMSNTGGQTWDSSAANWRGASHSGEVFWCEFDGTWDARPSLTPVTTTEPFTVAMMTFRPADTANHVWSYHLTPDTVRNAAAANYTLSQTTTTVDSTIIIIVFHTADDNGLRITGSTDAVSGDPYTDATWKAIRNGSGFQNIASADHAITLAYRILAAAGGTGAVADTQVARGNDAWAVWRGVFR